MDYILTKGEYEALLQRAGDPEIIKRKAQEAYEQGKMEVLNSQEFYETRYKELLLDKKELDQRCQNFSNQVKTFKSLPWIKKIFFEFNYL